jgi:hypothetical protein
MKDCVSYMNGLRIIRDDPTTVMVHDEMLCVMF